MAWYGDQAYEVEAEASTSHVLSVISGNAQLSLPGLKQDCNGRSSMQAAGRQPRHHYPTPKLTLPSNDRRVNLRQKLDARRLKKRIRHAQMYLLHPKFLEFRNRPRRDVDKKTGQIIWDEVTEAAFQNAIINIPAIGRSKKSQHGKGNGRNELVAEWIKQETGKMRTRKQVSSHIQTLDKLFNPKPAENFPGIPEWRMMNKFTAESSAEYEVPDFYENSIADMVQHWRMLQIDLSQTDVSIGSMLSIPMSSTIEGSTEASSLSQFDFEMWVSLPDKMEEALHRYTRVQSNLATSEPEPLDIIEGWSLSWPELGSILDRNTENNAFEVILVNTSFELMLDFPPPRSKLGINLELDFASTMYGGSLQDLGSEWSCDTQVHHRGRLESQATHHQCHSPGPGKVKIPFESRWWAELFTRLTEKRRHAVDSGNDAAVAIADESARNYLNNLKITQQIFRAPAVKLRPDNLQVNHDGKPRLAAILIWSFSKVADNSPGATTWRKLTLPTEVDMNQSSLLPRYGEALPTLSLDSVEEVSFDQGFTSMDSLMPSAFQPLGNTYPPDDDPDEELCQDGLAMNEQQHTLALTTLPYQGLAPFAHLGSRYQNHQAFQMNMNSSSQYNLPFPEQPPGSFPADVLERQEHLQLDIENHQEPEYQQYPHSLDIQHTSNYAYKSQALMAFDSNTHKILQAQLQDPSPDESTIESHKSYSEEPTPSQPNPTPRLYASSSDDQSLRNALSATSLHHIADSVNPERATDVIDLRLRHVQQIQHDHTRNDHIRLYNHLQPTITAPRAIRPSLQHHHTFSGVFDHAPSASNVDPDARSPDNDLDLDQSSRHDFNLLLNNLGHTSHDAFINPNIHHQLDIPLDHHSSLTQAYAHAQSQGNHHNFGYGTGSVTNLGLGLGVTRPHSQPPPMGAIVDDMDFGDGTLRFAGRIEDVTDGMSVDGHDDMDDGEQTEEQTEEHDGWVVVET